MSELTERQVINTINNYQRLTSVVRDVGEIVLQTRGMRYPGRSSLEVPEIEPGETTVGVSWWVGSNRHGVEFPIWFLWTRVEDIVANTQEQVRKEQFLLEQQKLAYQAQTEERERAILAQLKEKYEL